MNPTEKPGRHLMMVITVPYDGKMTVEESKMYMRVCAEALEPGHVTFPVEPREISELALINIGPIAARLSRLK